MPIREVASDRDVRAPRLLPSAAQLSSAHSLRRGASVIGLVAIDVCALLLSAVLVPAATGLGWFAVWQGLTWWDLLLACAVVVVVAAVKGLYGRRSTRHHARLILTTWTSAFVATLLLMLVIGPVGIGARYVAVWVVGFVLSAGGRYAYDALIDRAYGVDGDAPPALLLGSMETWSLGSDLHIMWRTAGAVLRSRGAY